MKHAMEALFWIAVIAAAVLVAGEPDLLDAIMHRIECPHHKSDPQPPNQPTK